MALGAPLARTAEDPKEIVRQALKNDTRNRELERLYTYTLKEETRKLDSRNAVKSTESKTWEVIPLQGGPPFRRLLEKDGRPLSPKEEHDQAALRKKQEDEQRKRQELREKETPEQKQKRLDARDRTKQRNQEQVDDIVNGFDVRLVGEDRVDGMPVWVIEGEPHKGYKFHDKMAATVASKMKGRIWVTKDGFQAVRVDAETVDTISIGGFLARINKGTRIHVEYTFVNGEVWLPKREVFSASARLLLLKGFHEEGDSTFTNYRKFTTDSRIVSDR
ncbi:MAG TPA: hypothetical protein VG456_16510 [Candidatus Sulfopaludibacter sp.]|jgi:hypothetical protein|nr:hypothetical protein [Candidatus Sulfopaludibacter sp.]